MSKYRAKPTYSADGILHPSKREAQRWDELRILGEAGEIYNLERQVKYTLIPAQYETYERYGKRGQRLKDGRRLLERAITYTADFKYQNALGEIVVEDAKGMRVRDFPLRRKLMLWVYGIRVREV